MAKKYYAVRKGHHPGIYDTWAACQAEVKGYSCASYKSFPTLAEAEAFVAGAESSATNAPSPATAPPVIEAVAYVDGSFDKSTGRFSCGVVFLHKNQETHFSEVYDDADLAPMHNVAGELKGAELAMRHCLREGIGRVAIYYDYEGIAKWCTGEWKAKKAGTIAYKAFYQSIKNQLQVVFVKVKGHSGNTYNDLADQLARQAIGK